MESSMSFFIFLLLFFHVASSRQPLCHDSERSALLRFKESFSIDKSASGDPSAYCKTELWNLEEGGDCCLWDGIECNEDTGYVIELDLGSSCLYGFISSTNALFNLVHLQWLSLADNNFNDSKIPSGIKNLSNLSHLNLSWSVFSGQIPSEMLELSKLESLALDRNGALELQQPAGQKSLVQKLTHLRVLDLDGLNLSSSLPYVLTDLSSLNFLSLANCNLKGQIPSEILELSQLEYLDLSRNSDLQPGGLRSPVDKLTNLKWLDLSFVNISSPLPNSLGNLSSLTHLSLRGCNLQGTILSSLGNLKNLVHLDLSGNNLRGTSLSSLDNLTNLAHLEMRDCNLSGQDLASSLSNLTQLTYLDLSQSNFSIPLLSWINKNTKLTHLGLSNINIIGGEIPLSLMKLRLSNLTQLEFLDLSRNKLQGTIPLSLMNLNQLSMLDLSSNQLSGHIPSQLSNLTQLEFLDLSSNKLQGIPSLETKQEHWPGQSARKKTLHTRGTRGSNSKLNQIHHIVSIRFND